MRRLPWHIQTGIIGFITIEKSQTFFFFCSENVFRAHIHSSTDFFMIFFKFFIHVDCLEDIRRGFFYLFFSSLAFTYFCFFIFIYFYFFGPFFPPLASSASMSALKLGHTKMSTVSHILPSCNSAFIHAFVRLSIKFDSSIFSFVLFHFVLFLSWCKSCLNLIFTSV